MLFSTEEFFKKVEKSYLTVVWEMICQRSHILWCASCRLAEDLMLLVSKAKTPSALSKCLSDI